MLKLGGWPRLTWGRTMRGPRRPRPVAGARHAPGGWGRCEGGPPPPGSGGTAAGSRGRPPSAVSGPVGGPLFGPPRRGGRGGPASASGCTSGEETRGGGASLGVTPRQACPRPDGLGRNLRSKTRWFAGFCNSHQVPHFATFFIDARAEISVAESRTV